MPHRQEAEKEQPRANDRAVQVIGAGLRPGIPRKRIQLDNTMIATRFHIAASPPMKSYCGGGA